MRVSALAVWPNRSFDPIHNPHNDVLHSSACYNEELPRMAGFGIGTQPLTHAEHLRLFISNHIKWNPFTDNYWCMAINVKLRPLNRSPYRQRVNLCCFAHAQHSSWHSLYISLSLYACSFLMHYAQIVGNEIARLANEDQTRTADSK